MPALQGDPVDFNLVDKQKVQRTNVKENVQEAETVDYDHEVLGVFIEETDATPHGRYLMKFEALNKMMVDGVEDQLIGTKIIDMVDADWFTSRVNDNGTQRVELFGDDLNAGVVGTISLHAKFIAGYQEEDDDMFDLEGDTDEVEHFNSMQETKARFLERWQQLQDVPLPTVSPPKHPAQAPGHPALPHSPCPSAVSSHATPCRVANDIGHITAPVVQSSDRHAVDCAGGACGGGGRWVGWRLALQSR